MTHALPLLDAPATALDDASLGALETARGCLPLAALEVRGRISGLLAHTSVRQTFRNAFDEPLEATYIFPLPERAAVSRFRMTVGEKVIEGMLKERGRARQEYEEAIEQGHRAAIAEEERSGVFTLRVGNIPPQQEAMVELEMVGPLEVSDGEATYRFPLVVAPRYTPGVPLDGQPVGDGAAPDTDQVPDASRVTPPVLLPGFPNPVRLSLEVELDPAGLADGLSGVRSSLHSVVAGESGPPWTIRLQPGERLNRDFILRFPVAKEAIQTTLQCSPASKDQPGVFALTLTPPAMNKTSPKPREVVFVLDRSGSMSGWKMVAARRALGRMIDTLLDQDRFTVIAFDSVLETPTHRGEAPYGWGGRRKKRDQAAEGEDGASLLSGTNRHRWQVLEWLGKIDARDGTEMGPALELAMRCFSSAATDVDRVLVIVTDGQVTGEDALLRTLKKAAGGAMPRVFTLGIDQTVNAGLLRRLADLSGGTCELVESEDRLDAALERVHRLIGQPVLTDVRLELLDFDGVAESLSPARTAGLYAGRPLTIFGRHLSEKTAVRLRVHAVDAAGQPWSADVAAQPGPAQALLNLWGRAKVRELEDQYAAEGMRNEKLSEQIVRVSLESGVLSRFTAYVAVDKSEVVNPGGRRHQVIQPVELPAGWEAEVVMACAPTPSVSGKRMMRRRSRHLVAYRLDISSAAFERSRGADAEIADEDLCLFDLAGDQEIGEHTSPLSAWAAWVFQTLGGRRKRKLDAQSLQRDVSGLRLIVERMKSAASLSRDDFAALIEALKAIAAVLDRAGHAAKDDVRRLADEGRRLLESWDAAGDWAAVQDRVTPFLEDAARLFDAVETAARQGRGAFWK